ncbi:Six-hairpin glycosidase-like protein [Podospora didyma]|uniref:Six-hairpin glycosidase-like protein n=1 Tax=Podospora didyma TaxID=330526 RepID=A0AAE0KLD6_9PEZI|nr:Six-hairpin glycosidase-like protein [Podospora didyma]
MVLSFSTPWAVVQLVVVLGLVSSAAAAGGAAVRRQGGYQHPPLPDKTLWPGPWEAYIAAPENKSHIEPARFWKARGNITVPLAHGGGGNLFEEGKEGGKGGLLFGAGGVLTLEFDENIAGRVCLDVSGIGSNGKGVVVLQLAYSESSWFAGPVPDATTDRQERDLPLDFEVSGEGTVCVGKEFVRGAFKYLTISLPYRRKQEENEEKGWKGMGQKVLGMMTGTTSTRDEGWVRIASVWVNCTAFPSQKNGRAYTGYFYSSNDLLNRIWYAGAWTLQLSTLDPKEGSALIDYNRLIDHNKSPIGSWYSNFTISNGSAVTTDGAKRDRMVWPGDMYIAVPGIAVSTNDMDAVRNALEVLYANQYADGSLPYAGPPMGFHGEFSDTYHLHTLLGTYNYVLFSDDLNWLRDRWDEYLRALRVSISKVDELGLLHVSSTADWLRPGMTGHNLEATAILYTVLSKTKVLAEWIDVDVSEDIKEWDALQKTLEEGLARLYCPDTGLFSDNVGRRGFGGDERVDPQDGNSWALISKMNLSSSGLPWKDPKSDHRSRHPLPEGPPTPRNISANLRSRWTAFGAPATEFPNVISPFASGFELLAHCAADEIDVAVELMLLEWGYLLKGDGFTGSTLAEGFRVDGHPQYPAYWSTARNSQAHGWSSGPTGVLTGEVLGIELTLPGGRGVWIHHHMTKWLRWMRGGYATDSARIEVKEWRCAEWAFDATTGTKQDTGGRAVILEVIVTPVRSAQSITVRVGDAFTAQEYTTSGGTTLWVTWEDDKTTLQRIDFTAKVTARHGGGDLDGEDWFNNTVVNLDNGSELVYDEDFVLPDMEHRAPGMVDWDAMELHFKTPPPEGWKIDRLKEVGNMDWDIGK